MDRSIVPPNRIGLMLLLAALLAGCPSQSYDQAWEEAIEIRASTVRVRGLVLYLHGCGGLLGMPSDPSANEDPLTHFSDWQQAWIHHLTRKGWTVIAPWSFADPRPMPSCKYPYRRKERIYSIRRQQTANAITKARQRFPNLPIVVWGHSEGGGVANLIDLPVDGIITTGYQCGFRSSLDTQILPDVPLLAIQGTDDSYIQEIEAGTGMSLDEICHEVFVSPKWQRLIIHGMGHSAPLRHGAIRDDLDRFLREAVNQ